MSHYNSTLGFTPNTPKEDITELRTAIEIALGIKYASDAEFLATNIYLLFQGYAAMKMKLENDVVMVVNNFFKWLVDNKIKIGFAKSGTYGGIMRAFREKFRSLSISSANNDKTLVPGTALLGIDNYTDELGEHEFTPQELEDIRELFFSYWPVAAQTYKSETEKPSHFVTVEFSNNQIMDCYFQPAELVTLYVKIEYRALDEGVIPGGAVDILKRTFVESFSALNYIGVAFEPARYLSSQNVDWLAEVKVKYKLSATDPGNWLEGKINASKYYTKFVLATGQDGSPLIEVGEITRATEKSKE